MHSPPEVNADIANNNTYLEKIYKALDSLSLKRNNLFEKNKTMLLDAHEHLKGLPGRPQNYVTCYVHFLEAKLRFFKEFLQTTTASTETIQHLTAIKISIELILQINKKYADTTSRDKYPPELRDKLQKIEMEGLTADNFAPLIPELLKATSKSSSLANLPPEIIRNTLSTILDKERQSSSAAPKIHSLIDLCVTTILKNKEKLSDSLFFYNPKILNKFPALKTHRKILAESIKKILEKFKALKDQTPYQKLYAEVHKATLNLGVYNLVNRAVRNFIAENKIESIDENSFEGNLRKALRDYSNETQPATPKPNKPI